MGKYCEAVSPWKRGFIEMPDEPHCRLANSSAVQLVESRQLYWIAFRPFWSMIAAPND